MKKEETKKLKERNYKERQKNFTSHISPLISQDRNGITLISLIITIIVMLILVVITISIVAQGKLFYYAGNSQNNTEVAMKIENEILEEKIEIDGKKYNSIEEYLQGPEIKVKIITNTGNNSYLSFNLGNNEIQEQTVRAEVSGTNDKITWTVEDPNIVQLVNTSDSEAILQPKSPGCTNLVATVKGVSGILAIFVAPDIHYTSTDIKEFRPISEGKTPSGITYVGSSISWTENFDMILILNFKCPKSSLAKQYRS